MAPDPQQSMHACPNKNKSNNFTMVFIDLDDTLIPTTIRNSIRLNFGFELFKIMDTKTLQCDIINSLNKMRKIIHKYQSNDRIRFALVSNASTEWIDDVIHSENAKFPVLAKYLKDNNIQSVSAIRTASQYLTDQLCRNAKDLISK
eukprot:180783_1